MRMALRNLLCLCLVLAKSVQEVNGFVAPSLRTRHSFESSLESATDTDSNSNKQEEPSPVLVNFPEAGTPSADDNGGYSLNGYTGNSAPYQNALGDAAARARQQQNQQSGGSFLNRNNNAAYNMEEFNEDGYGDMRSDSKGRNLVERVVKFPFRAIRRVVNGKKNIEPGVLILVRHGESVWNANKTFTGWADPDLSADGVREVEHAARLLLEGGWDIDLVFTSRLKRAIRSAWIILQELNEVYLPVFKSWRLNERMYGGLTGLSKLQTADKLGSDLVQEWRGSLRTQPPPLNTQSPYWPGRDRKYADLTAEQIPLTESLMDCMQRTEPVWNDRILYELKQGRNVLVVAHANTLRGLVKIIDNIGDDEIQDVAIPTGIPIVYKFDKQFNPIPPHGDNQTASQLHMNGLFLEKPGLLREALAREAEWAEQVPGYNSTLGRDKNPLTSMEQSLYKLQAERELGEWAGQFIDPSKMTDDGNDGNMQKMMDDIWANGIKELATGEQFDPDGPAFHDSPDDPQVDEENEEEGIPLANFISSTSQPCITPIPSATLVPGLGSVPVRTDGVIVLIRHGKTEHNKLGLFTGWEDAPLAPEGIVEAKEAGKLLRSHGFEFDVVYTSWLSRAIDTAWLVLDEMDCLWLPIIKSWRLNERMYGDLTGMSKQMVKQRHGEEQFKAWRRGFKVRPPPVSSFSQHYPGNDSRYVKYLNDARPSVRESMIRSIETGKITLHKKFPKSESLSDCMDRTIPFFTECITPDAIEPGKRVLISSSENAIRGLLMHLCEIPVEKITDLEIPNGLPLVFDTKSKCLKLLDDGTGRDPLKVHNFGKSASYLFRPCTDENGNPDEECDITYSAPISLTTEDQAAIAAIRRQP